MKIVQPFREELFERAENYKLMKKLVMAETEEELTEIGICFNLDQDAEEMKMAKESVLMMSQIPKQ